jgi:hypothetical protein
MDSNFLLRQLPETVLNHYKAKGITDVNHIRLKNYLNDKIAVILVQPAEGAAMEIWECDQAFHNAIKNLPKQIFRAYRQQKALPKIQEADFFMTGETQTIRLDLGNKTDTWQWLTVEAAGGAEHNYNAWQRVTSILCGGPVREFPKPKWTFAGRKR